MSAKKYTDLTDVNDVVISTRIRFARNLREYPFPCRLSDEKKRKVASIVKEAVLEGHSAISDRFRYIQMSELTQEEAVSLVERHLVSPEFISDRQGRGLLLLDDESVSIMINEEDHVRIQVLAQGMKLDEAYELADKIDTLLDESLNFAFNEKLGYLTQCPTNIGTGMRASLMLHLPALQESGAMGKISASLSKLGIVLRGLYGEGSEPSGAVYQLSNQVTLGITEREAIKNLNDIAMQLVQQERNARDAMSESINVLDEIYRSYGILMYAKLVSNSECMKLLSNVRFGVEMGCFEIDIETLNRLLIEIQPATLMKNIGKKLSPAERDHIRAELVKTALSQKKIPTSRRLENN
ncbi:MAG: protein arginine kinase [Clostridia bacterium]|nr:protein arginine kinase [Clostridia bacterium]